MIQVTCFTNLDRFKREEWPSKLVVLPRIGEGVQAKSGAVLFVCAITHAQGHSSLHHVPSIQIELHNRPVGS